MPLVLSARRLTQPINLIASGIGQFEELGVRNFVMVRCSEYMRISYRYVRHREEVCVMREQLNRGQV